MEYEQAFVVAMLLDTLAWVVGIIHWVSLALRGVGQEGGSGRDGDAVGTGTGGWAKLGTVAPTPVLRTPYHYCTFKLSG